MRRRGDGGLAGIEIWKENDTPANFVKHPSEPRGESLAAPLALVRDAIDLSFSFGIPVSILIDPPETPFDARHCLRWPSVGLDCIRTGKQTENTRGSASRGSSVLFLIRPRLPSFDHHREKKRRTTTQFSTNSKKERRNCIGVLGPSSHGPDLHARNSGSILLYPRGPSNGPAERLGPTRLSIASCREESTSKEKSYRAIIGRD
mmetsp:Transcript_20781/g.51191  ORF Transcript_20781/g.51191 Transcript_20781/m.51191 type:complete len:204 (+) Transcript_20781:660-1271(+)